MCLIYNLTTCVTIVMFNSRRPCAFRTKRSTTVLLKDPGFSIEAIGALISDDPFSTVSPTLFEEEPTTSTAVPKSRRMTTEGFSLRHRKFVVIPIIQHCFSSSALHTVAKLLAPIAMSDWLETNPT